MITYYIIILTVAVSILGFMRSDVFDRLKFNPAHIRTGNEHWRFLSYALLHADFIHLLVNIFVLHSFGPSVESLFRILFGTKGTWYFALLYVGGTALSVLPAYGRNKDNLFYSAVGASGAISAVVFSMIIMNPMSRLSFIFIPISFPAIVFGVAYLAYSWIMAKKGDGPIGHDTHFWGGIFGIVFTIALKPVLVINFVHQIL